MAHLASAEDQLFRAEFESGTFPPSAWDHRAHVRLAYVFLTEHKDDVAFSMMQQALLGFLESNGFDASKYHDTMTRAWILAVRHFMARTPSSDSADSFIDQNPELLDSKIMMTHYSAEALFSEEARKQYVEPDLDPIPRHRH